MSLNISNARFCVNRKIAPSLSIPQFFKLVSQLGIHNVELRNDMPGGRVTDDLSGDEVNALARESGIRIVTINALYPFNQLNEEVLQRARQLLSDAQAVGAASLVLCPLNDGTPISAADTIRALKTLASLFADAGIQGLVEPLGFPQSSLRSATQAQTLIREAGVPFRLLIDTFHHHLFEDAEQTFEQEIDIQQIGLVHLSGVTDPRPVSQLTDEERIMLSADDRLHSKQQVERLEKMGYTGLYAFEPFSSVMNSWQETDITREIRNSIQLLNHSA
ncbi:MULTISPECIES: TIM barrel protein [unclassified Pantoea]|uniref:TIM barrel protein n=1 Tax=unclassified Pantoea TaxID=2630326 RepID=UPI00247746EE|nr:MULTISPECIES: TIM barrel protein [unclassified Pantoea]GME41505.1 TIM barrel protein [Pantoea sp. QMID3]GME42466.1 TIM barrel protein [Pantoea sp. QMID1]GME57613.1 TIM barrel protein [Pantoea sp. QMID4]GME58096.1 TIM barrel protein [Pantoea sp. QMID2]